MVVCVDVCVDVCVSMWACVCCNDEYKRERKDRSIKRRRSSFTVALHSRALHSREVQGELRVHSLPEKGHEAEGGHTLHQTQGGNEEVHQACKELAPSPPRHCVRVIACTM